MHHVLKLTNSVLDKPTISITRLDKVKNVIVIKDIGGTKSAFVQFGTTVYDAYTSQGRAVGVLNITKGTSSNVALNLAQGKYILLATATWIPGSEDITGYAIFSYMINIVP